MASPETKMACPRRWRMTRVQRLSHARAKWGLEPPPCVKTFVRHYANWFRIDRLCAAVEVQKLGFPVDPTYVARPVAPGWVGQFDFFRDDLTHEGAALSRAGWDQTREPGLGELIGPILQLRIVPEFGT